MKVQLFREDGLVTMRFEPAVYVSAAYGTSVILTDEEYALLETAQRDLEAKEAAESGDFETEPKEDERKTEAWLDA